MSKWLKRIKHDKCGGSGLQLIASEDGGIEGYCFSCNTQVKNPLGEDAKASDLPAKKPKTEEQIQQEIAEISGYQTVDVAVRKLKMGELEYFDVKVAVSEEDGKTPTLLGFPYTREGKLVGYKLKTLGEKRIWSVGSLKGADMFGWEQAKKTGSRRIIVTEGEEDAVAMQMILNRFTKEPYEDNKPAVVSLPFGASSVKSYWNKFYKQMRDAGFDQIILCFDNDKVGQEAVQEAHKLSPEAMSVKLPAKDANACIMEGKSKRAFNQVMWKAEKPKNTRVILADTLFEEASKPAEFGELTWPWPSVNDITRGISYGQTIYLGAGAKMGKSEVVDTLIAHFIEKHNVKVFAAKPEQANKLTVKKIAGKISGNVFHDPKVEFDIKDYYKACEIMKGKLHLVNLYQHVGWETLKGDIISAASDGCKAVFIDPITNLTNGINAAEANTKLQEIAQELSSMALDLNIVIFIFCHLKSPDGNISKDNRDFKYSKKTYIGLGNCPHEFGGDVLSAQFAGSRAMMRSCNYMFGLEGNKDPNIEDSSVRNTRHLKLLEDREFGETGIFPLYWNSKTTKFTEA